MPGLPHSKSSCLKLRQFSALPGFFARQSMKVSYSAGHSFFMMSMRGAFLSSRANLYRGGVTQYPCFRAGCCASLRLRTCTTQTPFPINQLIKHQLKSQHLTPTNTPTANSPRTQPIAGTLGRLWAVWACGRHLALVVNSGPWLQLSLCLGQAQLQNYNWMSKGFFSALSALTVVAGTAAFYFWKKVNTCEPELIDRLLIKSALVTLRKRVFSSLREMAFIINQIRTLEGDLEPKKISDIFMRDGGSGEKKLQAIQALVLQDLNITQNQFQYSCNYYIQHDIEIRLLLDLFKKDLSMALEGVVESYHGPLPRFTPEKVLRIEEQIIKRRMQIISRKFMDGASNEECLRLEAQIQEYLREEGIHHQREPNEKLFMSMLEHFYREDSDFKYQFEKLELDMELFIIELDSKPLIQKHAGQRVEELHERPSEQASHRGQQMGKMQHYQQQQQRLRQEQQRHGQEQERLGQEQERLGQEQERLEQEEGYKRWK